MTKIFIIAGEASGDQLGGALMRELSKLRPDAEYRGIGGDEMLRAGLKESLFPMQELSLMGVVEVVPKLPKILNRITQTVMAVKVYNPDVVITIDSPDFCFRVQRELKNSNSKSKRIHYVAPTVWAWRPERARKIAAFLDGLICLFPFEPDYFINRGLKTVAVGHPVLKAGALDANGGTFRNKHGISYDQKVLGLFFGSRKSEMDRLSKILIGTAKSLQNEIPNLQLVIPTLPRWREYLTKLVAAENLNAIVTSDPDEKWDAIAACDSALAVSGTVALEISVVGVPHAILYRMNTVTWQIVRRMVSTKHAHLVNIILNRLVVPEFLQEEASVDKILPTMRRLLTSQPDQAAQKDAFAQVRAMLQVDPEKSASEQAANFVQSFLKS